MAKQAELERCVHSLTTYKINDDGMAEQVTLPCTLVFHTEEDKKGRPVHQTANGLMWS